MLAAIAATSASLISWATSAVAIASAPAAIAALSTVCRERRQRDDGRDCVRGRERVREATDAEVGIEDRGEHDVQRVLEAVDDEGRLRVAKRIEAAQRVEVDREGHDADGEPAKGVGGEHRVGVAEEAVLEQTDDDLP